MADERITVRTRIRAPVARVWDAYTTPEDITKWNFASDDWHCPSAHVDLRVGGTFSSRMESKDGKAGFDFAGRYLDVRRHSRIEYEMGDGRGVTVEFRPRTDSTDVEVAFDSDGVYSRERQAEGWGAILENFRKHVEGSGEAKS
ncbi:MAG TPA: SRPBCC domain-containing protein [Spirochaetia bacterium]|nr:SRPBCC domain-containing protein [Spirochaetales bacterium]HRY79808.1 SRPBCC domain-containing protein [Spirochaetia bacterium]HRZ88519.1 SRPBCC domain-containing protein [Spirochaetia bacterium]